jgi:3D (Asp-Asp-Asp) domain-containing protein
MLTLFAAACTPVQDKTDEPIATLDVRVSAYCLRGRTASGHKVRTGVAAADPDVLPIGSIVRLRGVAGRPEPREGVYTILDTGGTIRGKRIDLYIPSCTEAVRFGRRTMVADVLRRGWAPGG